MSFKVGRQIDSGDGKFVMQINLRFSAAAKCIGPDIIPMKYLALAMTSIVSVSDIPG